MGLTTRQGKGSKLTIQEMDGNLEYLEQIAQEESNDIAVDSFITTEEFYEVGDKQLIPDDYYYGSFEKGENTYHLIGMVEITTGTFDSVNRPGVGFYLATLKEKGSQLVLMDTVNIEEELSVDFSDYEDTYEFYAENSTDIQRFINGTFDGKVNFLLFNYIDNFEPIKNTFLSFDVDVNNSGEISITNVVDRKADDETVDTYDNIFSGYSITQISETYFGKETTIDNPEITYLFVEEGDNYSSRIDFLSYNLKTDTLDVIIEDFESWWNENAEVSFENISLSGTRIVIHNNKLVLWVAETFINQLDGNSYLVEFNPDKITALNITLNDFSVPLISKDKIHLVTVLQ